jgi:YVTN family beta-propeller protein
MVSVIDGKSMTVVGTLSVGRFPRGIAVNSSRNLVYVANTKDDTVSIIDGNTQEVVNTLPVGSQPNYVAVDSGLDKAFVSNTQSNNVYVIDGGDFHLVVGVIPVQVNPWGLTVDEAHNLLFVTNTSDHSLSVVQAQSHQVLVTSPTQAFPIDVAVDGERKFLYAIHRDRRELFSAKILYE